MKIKILFILLLSSIIGYGQNGEYQKVNVVTNFGGPILDTITPPYKLGEMRTRPQDGLLYRYNGKSVGNVRWDNMYYGPGQSSTPTLDQVLTRGNISSSGMSIGIGQFAGIKVPALGSVGNILMVTVGPDGTFSAQTIPGGGTLINSINGLTASAQLLKISYNVATSPSWNDVTATHTLNFPIATASADTGLVTPAQVTLWNGKTNLPGSGTSAKYLRGDTTWQTFPTIPAQLNATTAGGGITITGSYPNLVFTVSGAAGITALSGDVSATGTGSVATTINANVVSYGKIQQVTSVRILGNPTGSLANVSEISLGFGVKFVSTSIIVDSTLVGTFYQMGLRMHYTDTVSLSNRINIALGDTVSLSNRINLKLNVTDSFLYSTRAWRQKGLDSLGLLIHSGTLSGSGVAGNLTYLTTSGTIYTAPLINDSLNTRLVFGARISFPTTTARVADIQSIIASGQTTGYSISGTSSAATFNPIVSSVSASSTSLSAFANTAVVTTGNASSNGITLTTAGIWGDNFISFYNNNGTPFMIGETQRFGAANKFVIGVSSAQSFNTGSAYLTIDATGNITIPPLAGSVTQYVTVDNAGNLGVATIPTSFGVTLVGTFSVTPLTNGATIAGNTITLGLAGNTAPGMESILHWATMDSIIHNTRKGKIQLLHPGVGLWTGYTSLAGDTLYQKNLSVVTWLSIVTQSDSSLKIVFDTAAARTYLNGYYLNGAATITINGSTQSLSSNPSFSISGGTGSITNLTLTKYVNYDSITTGTGSGVRIDTTDGINAGLLSLYRYTQLLHPLNLVNDSDVVTVDTLARGNGDTLFFRPILWGYGLKSLSTQRVIRPLVDTGSITTRAWRDKLKDSLSVIIATKQPQLNGTGFVSMAGTVVSYLSSTQATAALNLFTASLQGLVPGSGGGTVLFLRADGTWAAPPGTGTVTTVSIGNFANLFTAGVNTASNTPAIFFTIIQAPPHTYFGNNTGSIANPNYVQPSFADLSGNISVSQLASGTSASASTFFRGDNTWQPVVQSFNSRQGNVIPTLGDYTFAQLASIPSTVAGYNITDAVTLTGTQTLTNKTATSLILTGVPTAPTAAPGTNTTQVATTAFVQALFASLGTSISGTYTATIIGSTNAAASTANVADWIRVGNIVTVSGSFTVRATAPGQVIVVLGLPVGSSFTAATDLSGPASLQASTTYLAGICFSDAIGDVEISFAPANTSTYTGYYTYKYIVQSF